ncbi:MAG: molybdopterin molybdotransferase MoeA [Thermodesulfobacteriota bacterium]|nr:molybdopterin molybdotransferase MoeA [Thermodesulfobacteriota bacterium]
MHQQDPLRDVPGEEGRPIRPEKRTVVPAFDRRLLDYETALETCLSAVTERLPEETVSLEKSLGRVLRRAVESAISAPPFDKSAMDGYAVKSADVAGATVTAPVTLEVIDEIPAGAICRKILRSGQAARIMTGAAVPQGADVVIKLENTAPAGLDRVHILSGVEENNYIIYKGQDLLPGSRVAEAGATVTPALLGLLANCGTPTVSVSRKPSIGIISTGSELTVPGTPLAEGRIYDVNSYLLYGLCAEAGADVALLGKVDDVSDALLRLLERSTDADILLLSGGMSVGDYDIVHETLQRAGVEEIFWRVKVKPGKPLFFGRRGFTLVFGLPGNPVSSANNFYLFVLPVIHKLLGRATWGLKTGHATVCNSMIFRPGRRKFLRAQLRQDREHRGVWIFPEQRSGVFGPMAEAEVLVEVPEAAKMVREGDRVKIYYL